MNDPNDLRRDAFLAALRDATHSLHTEAEKSGFVHDLLKGRATRAGYTLWLRNLQPAYEALERGLEALRDRPAFGSLAVPAVYRTAALESDLAALCGASWRASASTLAEGDAYARRIASIASDPARLAAHAYVRYLGDLNGGQVVGRIVARSLEIERTRWPSMPSRRRRRCWSLRIEARSPRRAAPSATSRPRWRKRRWPSG